MNIKCDGNYGAMEPQAIRWLWPGWLARGKLHILAGSPGTGKTTLAMALAATVTRGGAWPDGARASLGRVVIWSGEDDPTDTLAPHLLAAGADTERVYFVGGVVDAEGPRGFDLARDVHALGEALRRMPEPPALLIADPIVSAVAGDSHKNAEVRRALEPLVSLAQEMDCALVGITHYTKVSAGRDPLERVTGSLAFGALARLVWVTARRGEEHPEGPARIVARAKSNIGPDGGGFHYNLEEVEIPGHPGLRAIRVVFGAQLDGTTREILGHPGITL